MANEKLILEAQLRDNMSAGLKKISKELDAIGVKPGMKSANGWLTKLGKEAEGFVKSGGGAAGVINAMGIGGLTAAASLAGMVAQFKALGNQQLAMKELGREIGLTADQVNQFAHAGEHFGVAGDAMKGMLNSFAGLMPEFQRSTGDLFKQMSEKNWMGLVAKMQGESVGDALLDGLRQSEEIAKVKGKQAQKSFLEHLIPGYAEAGEKLFGDGGMDGFIKELETMKTKLSPISPEMLKQAQDYRDAIKDINIEIENLSLKAAPSFMKDITGDIKEIGRVLELLDKVGEKIDQFVDKMPSAKKVAPDIVKNWGKDALKWWNESGDKGDFEPSAAAPTPAPLPGLGLRQDPKITTFGGKFSNSSYNGQGGLFHNASWDGGGQGSIASTSFEAAIAGGTKTGFLAAIRELMAIPDDPTNKKYQKASFGGRDDRGIPGFGGGRGGSGGAGTHHSHGDLLGPGGAMGAARFKSSAAMTAHAKETYDFWRSQGYSHEAALGFVGNEQGEGTLGSGAATTRGRWGYHWDGSHYSGGIAQWDPTRRADILKNTGIDVWGNSTSHADQLKAEAWEIQHRYPQVWKALKAGKTTIGQAAHALVYGYELPADKGGQSRLRGQYGEAWGKRLQDSQRASGLNPPPVAGHKPAQEQGHVRADIHVHGPVSKHSIQSSGLVEAKLHRWPTMTTPSDVG